MTPRGVALVTGASSGIGLASSAALAWDGWHVVATPRNAGTAQDLHEIAATQNVAVRPLDVTSAESVSACLADVVSECGAVDLLVNNAGVGHRGTLEQLTDDELAASFDVNFWGVVRVTRAAMPAMRERRRGRIITVTSTNGIVVMPFSDTITARSITWRSPPRTSNAQPRSTRSTSAFGSIARPTW